MGTNRQGIERQRMYKVYAVSAKSLGSCEGCSFFIGECILFNVLQDAIKEQAMRKKCINEEIIYKLELEDEK